MNNYSSTNLRRRVLAPLFSAAFLLLFLSATNVSAQNKGYDVNRELELWKPFAPAGWNFKVSLPQEPQTVDILSAEVEGATTHGYELVTTTSRYSIFILKLSKPSSNFEQTKQFVQEITKGVPSGGFMIGDTFVATYKQNTRPNVMEEEVVLEKDGNTVTTKRFLTKTYFYQLQVTTPNLYAAPAQIKEVYQAQANKFFNSFQMVNNKPQTVRKTK
jgi:hypothetical protein